MPCNWFQCQENSIDPLHFEWMHMNWSVRLKDKVGPYSPRHLRMEFEEFDYGFVYRRLREGMSESDPMWTIGRVCLWPNALFTGDHFEWRVPIDDENTLSVTWAFSRVPKEPRALRARTRSRPGTARFAMTRPGGWISSHVMNQDFVAWVGQGVIADRTQEHLGSSDRGIIMMRQRFLTISKPSHSGEDPKAMIRDPESQPLHQAADRRPQESHRGPDTRGDRQASSRRRPVVRLRFPGRPASRSPPSLRKSHGPLRVIGAFDVAVVAQACPERSRRASRRSVVFACVGAQHAAPGTIPWRDAAHQTGSPVAGFVGARYIVPGTDARHFSNHRSRSPVGTAHVECGSLLPLFVGEACLAHCVMSKMPNRFRRDTACRARHKNLAIIFAICHLAEKPPNVTPTTPKSHAKKQSAYFRIATEEAFAPPELLQRWKAMLEKGGNLDPGFVGQWGYFLGQNPRSLGIASRLQDIGEQRIRDMDSTGIARQILSLTNPGVQLFDPAEAAALAISFNDQLADAIRKRPDRFSGLAAISPQNPSAAAKELERGVRKLGLKGAIINSHTKGEYLDDSKFWDIFAAAESLNVPIYLHPARHRRECTRPSRNGASKVRSMASPSKPACISCELLSAASSTGFLSSVWSSGISAKACHTGSSELISSIEPMSRPAAIPTSRS